ncbi:hypothetical protein SCLCIDRAFT_32797 [Scleroderma citrinum Foug A]|uniref:Uncharacterized protein n=1 Tax=Scleroderma citrinum Foug A TaxID=1036808 RepID=A0A0C3CUJ5_9AGAM|nr:hypothetical protein SCLCIDRAFT_32797 [Scleroderma citrinum Foug A]
MRVRVANVPPLIVPTPPHPVFVPATRSQRSNHMQAPSNGLYRNADKENYRETGGRVHRPSEKVRQAVHEREETVQRHDAKAQKAWEHRIRCLLMEEGSENEDEENSDEGQDLDDDGLEEEEGTHFSSHPVPTKLSAAPRQHPLMYSNSKVPKVVGGHIPDLSGEGSFFLSDGENIGLTAHEALSEQQTVQHKKNSESVMPSSKQICHWTY